MSISGGLPLGERTVQAGISTDILMVTERCHAHHLQGSMLQHPFIVRFVKSWIRDGHEVGGQTASTGSLASCFYIVLHEQ